MAKRAVNIIPRRGTALILGVVPLVLLLVAYLVGSNARLAQNPRDKLLPSLSTLAESTVTLATEPNRRTGQIVLWSDTVASLRRILLGVGIAALLALGVGIGIGLIPFVKASLTPVVAILSMVPPMSILPVLFIVFGLGETSKIVLIVLGIGPFLIRELALRVSELPVEQIVKAQTLGANTWLLITRVVAPQAIPRLLEGIRLALGPAWLFLIAAEAIAATEGLGYRIFLVRRYLAMDVILPYVAWITLLAFAADQLLQFSIRRLFPWYVSQQRG
ncbi:MAG: ABC transporter permease subunit [Pseudomonadota bacterium]